VIANNIVKDCTVGDIVVGLSNGTTSLNPIRDFIITGNILKSAQGNAIRVYQAKDFIISDNIMEGQGTGIVLGRNASIYVSGTAIITGNKMKNITNQSMRIETAEDINLLFANNIMYGGTYGTFFNHASNPNDLSTMQILNNLAMNMSIDGFYVKPGAFHGIQVLGNQAIGCTLQGFDTSTVDGIAKNNVAINCGAASNYSGANAIIADNLEVTT
jgi:hypothetical protein